MKTLLERLQDIRTLVGDQSAGAKPKNFGQIYTELDNLISDYVNGRYKIVNGLDN